MLLYKSLQYCGKLKKNFRKDSKINLVLKELRINKNNKKFIFKSCNIKNKFENIREKILDILISTY